MILRDVQSFIASNYKKSHAPDSSIRYSLDEPEEPYPYLNEPFGNSGVQFQMYDDPANLQQISSMLRMPLTERDAGILDSLLDVNKKSTFVEKLLEMIKNRGVKDSKVYKAAQVDRRLYSKMISDSQYKPAKDTVIALAIGLKCNFEEADDLLSRAGYTLSHSSKRDLILEYFFREKIYDLTLINTILYQMDQKILGR